MSIQYCDQHDRRFDTDYEVECHLCEWAAEADLEADRQYDEHKLRELEEKEWPSQQSTLEY